MNTLKQKQVFANLSNVSKYNFDGMCELLSITTPEGEWHFAMESVSDGVLHLFYEGGDSYRLHFGCKIENVTLLEMAKEVEPDCKAVSEKTQDDISTITKMIRSGKSLREIFAKCS